MKNVIKSKKGITLVALVVTIIILLILVGITISQLSGSGLFENAKLAEQESKEAQEKEEETLADYENKIGQYVDGSRDTITISKEEYEQLKNSTNFSKDEKIIGTWIDGKKLYSKTLELDYTTDNTQTFAHNIDNVDTIYIDTGNTFRITSSSSFPYFTIGIESSDGSLAKEYLTYIQSVNNTYIQIRGSKGAGAGKAYVTLKYTKTTD